VMAAVVSPFPLKNHRRTRRGGLGGLFSGVKVCSIRNHRWEKLYRMCIVPWVHACIHRFNIYTWTWMNSFAIPINVTIIAVQHQH
jgi:hypothetical protein